MNKAKEFGQSIKNGWEQLDKQKRTRLIVLVTTALVFISLIGYFTQRTSYTVLFSNLEDADAGAIVEDLEAQGMNYRLEDNGTTILIDEGDVDNYRIDLAVNGLMPESSTGFEIFDETSMMTTDDDRQIMYQRALTGELEQSISALDQVDVAKVMLSLPEDSIFQNPAYRSESSASIVLQPRGTNALSQQNIQGIVSLVTGAVDNLPMDNVQVVDTSGNLLSGFLQTDGDGIGSTDFSSNHQGIQRSYEQDLEQRIISLLAPVYGYDNLRVVVNASMNFDVVEGESVEYSAPGEDEQGLIRSQEESFDGAREMVTDLMGSDPPVADDEDLEEMASYNHTTNYELDQVTERYVEAPGVVENINASVVVNSQTIELPNQTQIEGIVGTALGLDNHDLYNTPSDQEEEEEVLNGVVTVQGLPFADSEEITLGGGSDFLEDITAFVRDNWIYMAVGLGVVILGIILLSLLRRGKEDPFEEEFALEPESFAKTEPEINVNDQIDKENEMMKQQNKVMSEKEDRVRDEAKENPELAAELMKVWLKE